MPLTATMAAPIDNQDLQDEAGRALKLLRSAAGVLFADQAVVRAHEAVFHQLLAEARQR